MMLDDNLYGLAGLAHELGLTFSELVATPYPEVMMWSAYFERRNAEASVRQRK